MSAQVSISMNDDDEEENSRASSSRTSMPTRSIPMHDPDRRSLLPPERESARHLLPEGANGAACFSPDDDIAAATQADLTTRSYETKWSRGYNKRSLVPEEPIDTNTSLANNEVRQHNTRTEKNRIIPHQAIVEHHIRGREHGSEASVTSRTFDKNNYRFGHEVFPVRRASHHTGDGDSSHQSTDNRFIRRHGETGPVHPGAVRVVGAGSQVRNEDNVRQSYEEYMNERSQSPAYEVGVASNSASLTTEGVASAYEVEEPTIVHEAKIINVKRQRAIRIFVAAGVLFVIVVAVVVPVVILSGNQGNDSMDIQFSVIIANLCSPRHMAVYDNKLFVPEAGIGPVLIASDLEPGTLCLPTNAIDPICFGNTGQVTTFNLDGTHSADNAPLTSLFSARSTEGGSTNRVYGASGIDFDEEGNMFTLLGLGLVNATNVAIQAPDFVFASVLRGNEVVASPWFQVFENNYAGVPVPESNPFHIHIHNGTTYVVDAGADLLYTYLNVESAGTDEPDMVIVLPKIENIPAVKPNPRGGTCSDVTPPNGPKYCGQYQDDAGNWLYTANPVPSAVCVNPKEPNRLYVAYLSGSFWNEPVSGIFYMDLVDGLPDEGTIKSITGDFWAVIDFAFYQGDLFVLETNPGGFVPFNGRLSRVTVDSNGSIAKRDTITEDLFEPVGLVIHNDFIYISNNTFNMGIDDCGGQILRAQLR